MKGTTAETLDPSQLLLTERGNAWLDGFDIEDREVARDMIRGLTLVSLNETTRMLKRLVHSAAATADGPVALFAVRELRSPECYFEAIPSTPTKSRPYSTMSAVAPSGFVGSEGHIASIITGIAKSDQTKYLNHPTIRTMRVNKCRKIILMDDLVGSGNRILQFINSMWQCKTIRSWVSLKYIKFNVVVYAATSQGRRHLETCDHIPSVLSYIECPTFPTLPWSRQRRQRLHKIIENYSTNINAKPTMYWGYKETCSSLVFEHSCPNNVPAILWSSAMTGKTWNPLFVNRSIGANIQSCFPEEIARKDPISVLIDAGQKRLASTRLQAVSEERSKDILVLLALVAKGQRRNEALSYALGISNRDLESIVTQCVASGWMTLSRRITARGVAELAHARKSGLSDATIDIRGDDCYHPRVLRAANLD